MLDRIQYADLKISLPGGILTKVDRTTMAYGLEVLSPFLDTELVDLATQLPDALRLHAGQGKWILKWRCRGCCLRPCASVQNWALCRHCLPGFAGRWQRLP
jgi:asparagine synthetase B (glutamine-hydrolysing)